MKRQKTAWYAASVIMYIQLKEGRQRSFPVHENVFLIAARSFDEARIRAEELGRAEESHKGLTLNGRPAVMLFGGVRKVVSCTANPAVPGPSEVTKLYDGVEATYSGFLVKSRKELTALIEGRPAALIYEE